MSGIQFDKKTRKTFCNPSTREILLCLAQEKSWCQLLLDHNFAIHKNFLAQLIARDFLSDESPAVLGKIAKEFHLDLAKFKKSLINIYEGIFDLNESQPDLFRQEGIRHAIRFQYFDCFCYLNLWLLVTPRLHETVTCNFVNAKVGTTHFSVTEVFHEIKSATCITNIFLEAGESNVYKKWLIDRAFFEQELGIMEVAQSKSFELDKKLRTLYR